MNVSGSWCWDEDMPLAEAMAMAWGVVDARRNSRSPAGMTTQKDNGSSKDSSRSLRDDNKK
jgi:hypothetical protein